MLVRLAHLLVVILFLLCLNAPARAQDARYFKREIAALCNPMMAGRGYVRKGRDRAVLHIVHRFRDYGVAPAGPDSSYIQPYAFPVNTFPDSVLLSLNGKPLAPGADFIIDAASPSFNARKIKITTVDFTKGIDSAGWLKWQEKFTRTTNRAWYFKGVDSLYKALAIRPSKLAALLPKGAYIIPQHGKMNWDVATETIPATVFYAEDSVLPRKLKKAAIAVYSVLVPAFKNGNIMGKVRGTAVPDSYLVFTAHYDHLGAMGDDAVFPGASDNASGMAMMLYLAQYYAAHPQRYSILFIAFSGEEAGLLGSRYYVAHPTVPLSAIRFLINIDIMGDATDGITVVNATEFPAEFSLLQKLNKKGPNLPQLRSRGKAAISDHYPFSEAGVRAFFLYSNGGPGFYHDIFDKPATLSLRNVPQVAKLLQDFVAALQ